MVWVFRRAALVAVCLLVSGSPAIASERALYRIFLQDGTALVSYGEFARVGDRVVFTVPIGAIEPAPQLHLVSIAESTVDWRRTDEYSEAVRARRYAETRGEDDFAALSSHVAAALNEVALTKDASRRLALAEEARGRLAEWPKHNYGYRASDVTQLLWLFDDVISNLRAAAGLPRLNLSLYATTAPPTRPELLAAPDARANFDHALAVARMAADPNERVSLLQAITAALSPAATAGSWEAFALERAATELAFELRVTHLYKDLAERTLGAAERHARRADVRGLERLIQSVHPEDERLGRFRPQETAALIATLDLRLDDTRRLRLARDSWTLRGAALRAYRSAIEPAVAQLRRSASWLEDIRALAGPSPESLTVLERRMASALQTLTRVAPPAELATAHALFENTVKMIVRAAQARRKALQSNDMTVAWEASSAAAGARMMFERALDEISRLTSPPQPR
jgi:hypothetical protein